MFYCAGNSDEEAVVAMAQSRIYSNKNHVLALSVVRRRQQKVARRKSE